MVPLSLIANARSHRTWLRSACERLSQFSWDKKEQVRRDDRLDSAPGRTRRRGPWGGGERELY
jgi:hypothetical protein